MGVASDRTRPGSVHELGDRHHQRTRERRHGPFRRVARGRAGGGPRALAAIAKTILISIPIGIAFFIGLLSIAVGGDLGWWAIVGLGTLIGLIAAALFGVLAGVVLNSEKLDEVDHDVDRGGAHDAA